MEGLTEEQTARAVRVFLEAQGWGWMEDNHSFFRKGIHAVALFIDSLHKHSLEERILKELRENNHLLHRIINQMSSRIDGFVILQEPPMLSIIPGNSPQFTATPVPATSVPSTPPTWTSSDDTNAPVTADATGLIATVALPTTAVVGTSFTLTVSYTNADGVVATGSTTQTIVAPPSPDITSFTIEQTA
jgi:hypothetical protein